MSLPQNLVAELVRQLLLDLLHLSSFAVVAQSSSHLLIGHFFAVSLLDSPAMCQSLFVFGGKLEGPFVSVHPPDTVLHVAVPQQVQQELVQTDLLLIAQLSGSHIRDPVSQTLLIRHLQGGTPSSVILIIRAALRHVWVHGPREERYRRL